MSNELNDYCLKKQLTLQLKSIKMKKFQNKRKHSEAQANAHQKADYLNELIW